jgi:hypothetical protein
MIELDHLALHHPILGIASHDDPSPDQADDGEAGDREHRTQEFSFHAENVRYSAARPAF